jgi:hypothetical protein
MAGTSPAMTGKRRHFNQFLTFRISFDGGGKSVVHSPASRPTRGAARDRHETRGGMRWTQDAPKTKALSRGRRRRVVLTSRCWVKSAIRSAGDGGKKAGHRGERVISRKPLRREGRNVSVYLCDYARVFFISAREAAGALGTRFSLRPLISQGQEFQAKLARNARRDREAVTGNEMLIQGHSSCPDLIRASINLRKNVCQGDGLPGQARQ